MKRISIIASGTALTLLALVVAQGCSSPEEGDDDDMQQFQNFGGSSAGTTAAPVAPGAGGAPVATAGAGGRSETAGTGGTPFVGMAGTTGSAAGGAPAGGTGGAPAAAGMAGMGGAAVAGGECPAAPSPSDGVACTATCTDLCGMKNLGTRLCTCTNSAFDCASCGYAVQHPLLDPPTAAFPPCDAQDGTQEDDETGCVDNERCQSLGRPGDTPDEIAGRFCGCLAGTWDCDSKPENFTF